MHASFGGRMNVRIESLGGGAIRLKLLQVAEQCRHAARGQRIAGLGRTHEGGDLMVGAQQRLEDSRADVSCRARQEDAHEGGYIIIDSMRRDSLLDFFGDLAATRGEFLVYDDGYRSRSYSYGETARAARAFAARLQATGITKGDKVVFWSENRPEWIIALWGCLLNGSMAVPIDFRASRDFLEKVSRIVDAKVVLLGDEVDQDLVEGRGLGAEGNVWKLSDIDWKNAPSEGFAPVAIARDDVA